MSDPLHIVCPHCRGHPARRAVMPIGSYHAGTASPCRCHARQGVTRVLEPEMSDEESKALERSADTLRTALARIRS